MHFDVITIFPEMFSSYFSESIIKRAQEKKLLKIAVHDLRKWATDKHHKVDDKPYGGGPGMVFMVEPIFKALREITKLRDQEITNKRNSKFSKFAISQFRIILTSARGKQFTAADAQRLAKYKRVVIICGRYEGVDERVAEHLVDEEISIGPYVLTGGELPAMVMIDAIARQVPGVLGKQESLEDERGSFPTYTRPEVFENYEITKLRNYEIRRSKNSQFRKFANSKFRSWKVPKVLLSGDHKKIAQWRKEHGG